MCEPICGGLGDVASLGGGSGVVCLDEHAGCGVAAQTCATAREASAVEVFCVTFAAASNNGRRDRGSLEGFAMASRDATISRRFSIGFSACPGVAVAANVIAFLAKGELHRADVRGAHGGVGARETHFSIL